MRNPKVAHIFATQQLRIIMKRDIFQAIADPTRRAILVLLASGTMTPNALAAEFDITRQAVSKHIQYLNDCDLVEQHKTGREIHYQLKLEKMKELDRWLNIFRKQWEDRFSQLDNLFKNLNNNSNEK